MTTLNDFKYSLLTDQDKLDIDNHNKNTCNQLQQQTLQQQTSQQTSQQQTSQQETNNENIAYDYCNFYNFISKMKNCFGIDNPFTFF